MMAAGKEKEKKGKKKTYKLMTNRKKLLASVKKQSAVL
jgi:hypothetical protein